MSPLACPFASSPPMQERRSGLLLLVVVSLTLWLTWSAP